MSTKFSRQTEQAPAPSLRDLAREIADQEAVLRQGGGPAGQERQRRLGRLTVRERLDLLLDPEARFFELGLWAGYGMYDQWGALPAAGVVAGIGRVSGRAVMVIANDATVKAGAMFPQSIKKVLRAQRIAFECRLPMIYLVDSSGVFLPLQDEIFPDEDDFGRIFRQQLDLLRGRDPAVRRRHGQLHRGRGYLPVLCDKLLMTEGSGLYLAGPALVKAAIGQNVDAEELGGAQMHAEISGTVDFQRAGRSRLPGPPAPPGRSVARQIAGRMPGDGRAPRQATPRRSMIWSVPTGARNTTSATCWRRSSIAIRWRSTRPTFGQTLVTSYASIGGRRVGIVANQRKRVRSAQGALEIGGVIYTESADKAARFVMDCNQTESPDHFYSGRARLHGRARSGTVGHHPLGAKLVNAVSNSIVPKITLVLGNSFGAGNYALCGKAYDPNFILAWPGARYAVMGAEQAAQTLYSIQSRSAARKGTGADEGQSSQSYEETKAHYQEQTDIRYGAARGWVDAIIQPHETRQILAFLLGTVERCPLRAPTFHTGVLQV